MYSPLGPQLCSAGPHVCFVQVPYWFCYYDPVMCLNWNGNPSSNVLFAQDCSDFRGLWLFHMNFRIVFVFWFDLYFSISLKNEVD